jgi:hypothetical protein
MAWYIARCEGTIPVLSVGSLQASLRTFAGAMFVHANGFLSLLGWCTIHICPGGYAIMERHCEADEMITLGYVSGFGQRNIIC